MAVTGRCSTPCATQRGLPLEEFYANAFTSEVDKHPG